MWLEKISIILSRPLFAEKKFVLDFAAKLQKEDLQPMHIVTYACLIQWLIDHGSEVGQGKCNSLIASYIYHDLGLKKYWRGSNHEETEEDNVFNLWRIVESEKDLYSKQVENYFKRTYFENKDLSRISLSLVEAFYNIFDHAQAKNNAFLHMSYDQSKMVLSIAVADLGLGLVNTVKNHLPHISEDTIALREAIKENFTISSTTHNRGKGLDTILSCADEAHIISGSALLTKLNGKVDVYPLSFNFPGTLLYYDIDLSSLDDEDYLDEFSF